jgi:hypothetical protein
MAEEVAADVSWGDFTRAACSQAAQSSNPEQFFGSLLCGIPLEASSLLFARIQAQCAGLIADAFKVRHPDRRMGRGLFTTRAIAKGETLFTERPLLWVQARHPSAYPARPRPAPRTHPFRAAWLCRTVIRSAAPWCAATASHPSVASMTTYAGYFADRYALGPTCTRS